MDVDIFISIIDLLGFNTDALILKGITSCYIQLWLMFIKHKMHTNSDVFQQRFSEGRSTSEDKGDTQ